MFFFAMPPNIRARMADSKAVQWREPLGENKKLRKQRGSLRFRVKQHREKIYHEEQKPNPNQERISYWEKEIANWLRQIEEIDRKLPN